MFLSFGS